MKDLKINCRVALIQAEPFLFDKVKTLALVKSLLLDTKIEHPDLVVFPELFIPGYPYGMSFGFNVGERSEAGRKDWKLYYDNSIIVPGPETKSIGEVVKQLGIYLSIGVSERDAINSSLYNSNLIFNPSGELIAIHRKLKPTGSERVVWGDANKDYFPVVSTPWGPMGSLICWENYMPLARVALYQKGITIYLAPNTNDNPEWQDTVKHIAIEGHCYVINANMFFTNKSYPMELLATRKEIEKLPEIVCRGGSGIIDPYGHLLSEPLWNQQGTIYADLDLNKVIASRMEFDGIGHYSRPDILKLEVMDK
jgi:nitrilase